LAAPFQGACDLIPKINAIRRPALCARQQADMHFFNLSSEGVLLMAIGTVKWFNSAKGFGFIQPDDGSRDAFVHISAVERAGLIYLVEGQKIEFDVVSDQRSGRPSAANLKTVG
jgi:CspA family cold shock protein